MYAAATVLAEVGHMEHGLFQMGTVADLAHAYGLALLILIHANYARRRV